MRSSGMPRAAMLGVVLAVLGAACSSNDAAEVEATSAEASPDETVETPDDGDPQVGDPDDVDPDDGGASDGGSELDQEDVAEAWPDPIATDVVLRREEGLVIELTEIRAEPSSVDVDVRITNGHSGTAYLNIDNFDGPSFLEDDTGTTYPLVPPDDNMQVELASSEVLEGTLSFAGPLAADATSLTLVINPTQEEEDQLLGGGLIPYLVSDDIPLTGDDDDGSDAGGDDAADDDGPEEGDL